MHRDDDNDRCRAGRGEDVASALSAGFVVVKCVVFCWTDE